MRIHRIMELDYDRNGISGAPFHVVLFEDTGEEASRKLGIVVDSPHHVVVLDVAKLASGNITFGQNSWRGDVYEPALRAVITERRIATSCNSPISDRAHSAVRLIDALFEELYATTEAPFTLEHVDFLERRFFEIREVLESPLRHTGDRP